MMHIDERIASFGKIDATPRLEVVDAYLAERNAVGKRVFPTLEMVWGIDTVLTLGQPEKA